MNPGTSNNNERSGDRDMAFSDLMRKPEGIRVADFDPYPICMKCEHPIAVWEVKRKPLPGRLLMSNTKYTRILADVLGVRAYFIHHQPNHEVVSRVEDDGEIILQPEPRLTVTRLDNCKERTFTYAEFKTWVEILAAKHVCTEENRARHKRCSF